MNRVTTTLSNCMTVTTVLSICLLLTANVEAQSANPVKQDDQNVTTAPVAIESVVTIGPENSRISFIGTHVGDDPKPRLGGFASFAGQMKVNPTTKAITSLVIDIEVDSVWTEFAKLTTHLKNADFFDIARFQTSRFASTKIAMGENGQCTIQGDLTLHGQTKEITFDAHYRFEDGGLLMHSKFQLDRSRFGMDQMLSGVNKTVELELVVGQKTSVRQAQQGHGGDSKKQSSQRATPSKQRLVSISVPNML